MVKEIVVIPQAVRIVCYSMMWPTRKVNTTVVQTKGQVPPMGHMEVDTMGVMVPTVVARENLISYQSNLPKNT
jgi:hypothetical protein